VTDPDEGSNFISAFKDKFARPERTEARRKAERRAGMTPAQRSRKGPPKTQINFRATAETKTQLDALAEHTDQSITDVIASAVDALARQLLGTQK
jgi:hypothetical protein